MGVYSIKSGSDDLYLKDIVMGWESKKRWNSSQLSSLVPFVQLFVILKDGVTDSRLLSLLQNSTEKIPAQLRYWYASQNGTLQEYSRIPQEDEEVSLFSVASIDTQPNTYRSRGDVGITQLQVNREIVNYSSAQYNLTLNISDTNIFSQKEYLNKLLILGSEFIILYGWIPQDSNIIDGGINRPPVRPTNNEKMIIDIGKNNKGFWMAQKISLWKLDYNLDQSGFIVSNLSFVHSNYQKMIFEKSGVIVQDVISNLKRINNIENNFVESLIKFNVSVRGFSQEDIVPLYRDSSGQEITILYDDLIQLDLNTIQEIIPDSETLLNFPELKFYITSDFLDREIAVSNFTQPSTSESEDGEGDTNTGSPVNYFEMGADLQQETFNDPVFRSNNPLYTFLADASYIYINSLDENGGYGFPRESVIYADFTSTSSDFLQLPQIEVDNYLFNDLTTKKQGPFNFTAKGEYIPSTWMFFLPPPKGYFRITDIYGTVIPKPKLTPIVAGENIISKKDSKYSGKTVARIPNNTGALVELPFDLVSENSLSWLPFGKVLKVDSSNQRIFNENLHIEINDNLIALKEIDFDKYDYESIWLKYGLILKIDFEGFANLNNTPYFFRGFNNFDEEQLDTYYNEYTWIGPLTQLSFPIPAQNLTLTDIRDKWYRNEEYQPGVITDIVLKFWREIIGDDSDGFEQDFYEVISLILGRGGDDDSGESLSDPKLYMSDFSLPSTKFQYGGIINNIKKDDYIRVVKSEIKSLNDLYRKSEFLFSIPGQFLADNLSFKHGMWALKTPTGQLVNTDYSPKGVPLTVGFPGFPELNRALGINSGNFKIINPEGGYLIPDYDIQRRSWVVKLNVLEFVDNRTTDFAVPYEGNLEDYDKFNDLKGISQYLGTDGSGGIFFRWDDPIPLQIYNSSKGEWEWKLYGQASTKVVDQLMSDLGIEAEEEKNLFLENYLRPRRVEILNGISNISGGVDGAVGSVPSLEARRNLLSEEDQWIKFSNWNPTVEQGG